MVLILASQVLPETCKPFGEAGVWWRGYNWSWEARQLYPHIQACPHSFAILLSSTKTSKQERTIVVDCKKTNVGFVLAYYDKLLKAKVFPEGKAHDFAYARRWLAQACDYKEVTVTHDRRPSKAYVAVNVDPLDPREDTCKKHGFKQINTAKGCILAGLDYYGVPKSSVPEAVDAASSKTSKDTLCWFPGCPVNDVPPCTGASVSAWGVLSPRQGNHNTIHLASEDQIQAKIGGLKHRWGSQIRTTVGLRYCFRCDPLETQDECEAIVGCQWSNSYGGSPTPWLAQGSRCMFVPVVEPTVAPTSLKQVFSGPVGNVGDVAGGAVVGSATGKASVGNTGTITYQAKKCEGSGNAVLGVGAAQVVCCYSPKGPGCCSSAAVGTPRITPGQEASAPPALASYVKSEAPKCPSGAWRAISADRPAGRRQLESKFIV